MMSPRRVRDASVSRETGQEFVSERVAVAVVHQLQIVDVDDEQCRLAALSRGARELTLGRLEEPTPVEHARQIVGLRQLGESGPSPCTFERKTGRVREPSEESRLRIRERLVAEDAQRAADSAEGDELNRQRLEGVDVTGRDER